MNILKNFVKDLLSFQDSAPGTESQHSERIFFDTSAFASDLLEKYRKSISLLLLKI